MSPSARTAAVLSMAAVALSACGTQRPEVKEVAHAMTSADALVAIPPDNASCAAKALVESDLSDATLRAIADNDHQHHVSAKEQDLLSTTLAGARENCSAQS